MVIVLSCSKKLRCSSTTDVDFGILQFVHTSWTFLPVPHKIDKLMYSTTHLAKEFVAPNLMKNLWKFCCNIEFLYFFNTAFWQNFKSHFEDFNKHKFGQIICQNITYLAKEFVATKSTEPRNPAHFLRATHVCWSFLFCKP